MTRLASWMLLLIAGILWPTPASAGPIFSYAFDQSSNSVAVGGTVDVTVYLQESDTSSPGSLPNGYLATTGLFGAGVVLKYSGQSARVLQPSDVTPSAEFLLDPTSADSVTVTSADAILVENIGLGSFVTAAGSGPVYDIELGVFRLTGISAGTASISADVTGSGSDLVGGDGSVLDLATASATAHIVVSPAAVPEPSSLSMVTAGVLALLTVMRVRRHKR
jgi:hypothetical protein